MAGVTVKQEAAIRKYLECGNKSEAYRFAYNTERMKDKTIHEKACILFAEDKVRARLEELQAKAAKRNDITVDRVLGELALLGFSNLEDYFKITSDGEPYVDLSELTREQAAALSDLTVDDYVEGRGEDARQVRKVRIKLHDKKGALVELGRYLGLFEKDKAPLEIKGPLVIIRNGKGKEVENEEDRDDS